MSLFPILNQTKRNVYGTPFSHLQFVSYTILSDHKLVPPPVEISSRRETRGHPLWTCESSRKSLTNVEVLYSEGTREHSSNSISLWDMFTTGLLCRLDSMSVWKTFRRKSTRRLILRFLKIFLHFSYKDFSYIFKNGVGQRVSTNRGEMKGPFSDV